MSTQTTTPYRPRADATHRGGAVVPPAPRNPVPPRANDRREALGVLIVENEACAAESLLLGLRRQGYAASTVATGVQALQAYRETDLVLLDLDLPDLDGLEVCRSIRASAPTPIIVVTGRDTELDRILGLQAGADDYMAKPYGFRELLARIEAVMRRVRLQQPTSQILTRGRLTIDPGTRQVLLRERPVELTRKEFDLLYLLAANSDSVISRQRVMAQVWEDHWSHSSRTIDTHVSSLRGKLGSNEWIVTVRGVGFRLGQG